MELIDKNALIAEITHKIKVLEAFIKNFDGISDKVEKAKNKVEALSDELLFIENLEVKDLYEQCVQYDSIKAGIQAHAETYSFNIESLLFNQLTKEQQALWRKEIEQACISGGEIGVELARDPRYKENVEVKDVNLIIHTIISECCDWLAMNTNLSHDEIEGCRNLMLTVKEEQFKT